MRWIVTSNCRTCNSYYIIISILVSCVSCVVCIIIKMNVQMCGRDFRNFYFKDEYGSQLHFFHEGANGYSSKNKFPLA